MIMVWLEDGRGNALRVGRRGLLLGRDPSCDVVLTSRKASRVQALVRHGGDGVPELLPLGRQGTRLNGATVGHRHALGDGDALELPDHRFTVRVASRGLGRPVNWAVEVDGALLVGLGRGPVTLGGGLSDRVRLADLPEEALTLEAADRAVVADLRVPARLGARALSPASLVELIDGDTLELGDRRLRLVSDGPARGSTERQPDDAPAPTEATFAFEPVGGQLTLAFGPDRYVVALSELRARLVATLLAPRGGHAPGDFVPDELVLPAVWPGEPGRGRGDLNTLVHRLRKVFAAAGVEPSWVIERAPVGRSTRLRLAPGARVSVT